jgi:hypothetical protein
VGVVSSSMGDRLGPPRATGTKVMDTAQSSQGGDEETAGFESRKGQETFLQNLQTYPPQPSMFTGVIPPR